MKTNQTFSILIWANKAKASNEGISLFARVTIDGKRVEFSLKRKVDPNLWDSKSGCVTGGSDEAKNINNYITFTKSELIKLYNQMLMLDQYVTAESLKLKFNGVAEKKKTLLMVLDYHNEQMGIVVGIDVVKATYSRFLSLRKKLVDYMKLEYRKSDFYLDELNHKFVTNYTDLCQGH